MPIISCVCWQKCIANSHLLQLADKFCDIEELVAPCYPNLHCRPIAPWWQPHSQFNHPIVFIGQVAHLIKGWWVSKVWKATSCVCLSSKRDPPGEGIPSRNGERDAALDVFVIDWNERVTCLLCGRDVVVEAGLWCVSAAQAVKDRRATP